MRGHTVTVCYTDDNINLDNLELENMPNIIKYVDSTLSIDDFDALCQNSWHMPEEYKNLDIAEWILNQCTTDAERQRVGEELLLYLDRNLFPLLQYLKYLVDTMRANNVVWGVGRGSSVSSYVLYLIGVHRINSMYYDLNIHEFLR
jgi:DNA polymerase III alpha subunit